MLGIILAVFAGCFVLERVVPGWRLPSVRTWPVRVLLINGVQLGVVVLAGQAIRAVALGVVVTALAQTILAGLGLAVAGIPFAGLLTGVILLLCIAQIGPILVLVPAVAWLFWNDQTAWGTALLVWTVGVGVMDNILRPFLIRRGADLPMLLIFAGVIGGLLAFGIVGLFVGPVVLAVTYTLLKDWMGDEMPAHPVRQPNTDHARKGARGRTE